SYGYNVLLGNTFADTRAPVIVTLGAVTFPSQCIWFGDATEGRPGWGYWTALGTARLATQFTAIWKDPDFYAATGKYPQAYSAGRLCRRHNEGANIAFVDGHVKWYRIPGLPYTDDSRWNIAGTP